MPVRTAFWLPSVCLFALTGCGGKDKNLTTHPVSGQVLYDGKPAAGIKVFLYPTEAPMPPDIPGNPHGVTGADGRFTITTFVANDGASEGTYTVLFLWPAESKGESEYEEQETDRLFGWYDAKNSKLSVQIKAGANELPAFKLPAKNGPPPVSEGIPGRN